MTTIKTLRCIIYHKTIARKEVSSKLFECVNTAPALLLQYMMRTGNDIPKHEIKLTIESCFVFQMHTENVFQPCV